MIEILKVLREANPLEILREANPLVFIVPAIVCFLISALLLYSTMVVSGRCSREEERAE